MLSFRMNMPFCLMSLYGSIMICVILLLRALCKSRLPKYVFPMLWGMVILRLLVPFSISSPISPYIFHVAMPDAFLFARPSAEISNVIEDIAFLSEGTGTSVEITATADYAVQLQYGSYGRVDWRNIRNILPILYFVGFAAAAGTFCYQKYGYSRKLEDSLLIEHNETINSLLRSMDMGHVLVFTNDRIASPLVCGMLALRIYLPTRMDFGNTVLLRYILVHETMHIRRRDNWLKAIMLIALCVNWFNPFVWIMSKCLASDLEAACDEAVLKSCDEEGRKDYALSLLAMAVTANRTTLLYSAFSKTEVEKRIKNIVHYKKASAFVLLLSILCLAGGTVVFATGGQAPFYPYLTSTCASSNSRWAVKATLSRDIVLGENPQQRAEHALLSVLAADGSNDPKVLDAAIKLALAEEFGVEKGAFELAFSLCLSPEELEQEYAVWGIAKTEDGFYLYQGEQVRIYSDRLLGSYQSREDGTVDISVERNSLGEIVSVTVQHEGDNEFDQRTWNTKRHASYNTWLDATQTIDEIAIECVP